MEKKTLITITTSRTMPGLFELAVQPAKGRAVCGLNAGWDAAGAAAIAIQTAIMHGSPYVIFAPSQVLRFIQPEFRSEQ